MKLTIIEKTADEVRVEFEGESHTILNLLRTELLADDLQIAAVNPFDVDDVSRKCRIHFDGQARPQIHAEGVVGQQHDAIRRQRVHQCFANGFRIGISQCIVVDFPYFAV